MNTRSRKALHVASVGAALVVLSSAAAATANEEQNGSCAEPFLIPVTQQYGPQGQWAVQTINGNYVLSEFERPVTIAGQTIYGLQRWTTGNTWTGCPWTWVLIDPNVSVHFTAGQNGAPPSYSMSTLSAGWWFATPTLATATNCSATATIGVATDYTGQVELTSGISSASSCTLNRGALAFGDSTTAATIMLAIESQFGFPESQPQSDIELCTEPGLGTGQYTVMMCMGAVVDASSGQSVATPGGCQFVQVALTCS
jgi:hypothetical protein